MNLSNSSTRSDLYFVCDLCSRKEMVSTRVLTQIEEDQLDQADFPHHCSSPMRLTILEPNQISGADIDLKSTFWSIVETIKLYFQRKEGTTATGDRLQAVYQDMVETTTGSISSVADLEANLLPAIQEVIDDETEQKVLQDLGQGIIDNAVNSARKRAAGHSRPTDRSRPILPGSQSTHTLQFFCSVCNETVAVDSELRGLILASDDEIDLPLHCDQPVQINIIQQQVHTPVEPRPRSESNQYDFFASSQIQEMQITSVGIDIGSSTSHLIFSQLDLRREVGFMNMTNRFNIIDRKILYKSKIIDTPLLDPTTIDIDSIVEFCMGEYELAGYTPSEIDTGAVIITGETAKKGNAAEIVNRLADESGKFVSAVAGPNFESLLAAMGSGAVARSEELQNTILNIDIGGGTSNLALISNGKVVDTSCINVGGRLLGIDADYKIWRIDPPTEIVMDHLGFSYQVGDFITNEDVNKIAQIYADSLIEVMQGPATSPIAKKLMMTADIDYSAVPEIDDIIFSGGVAEMIYSDQDSHNDIGHYIARHLKNHLFHPSIVEPTNKIRATVIGAGSYSLAISGSTIFYDDTIEFPLTNIPALVIDARKEDFSKDHVITQIDKAFAKYDLNEGEEIVALYFDDPIYARDMFLLDFVAAIEEALPHSIQQQRLIILVFRTDVGGTIGRTLRKETVIEKNIICLDEIELKEGDWIDIGMPINEGDTFPVTVKSLVFN